MSVPIEEVDNDGRAIFFKSPADVSKSITLENYEVSSSERVNQLFEEKSLPSPKFRGFVFHYSPYLTLCSRGQNGRHKVKQKISYSNIKAVYPCEQDPSILFMLVAASRTRCQVRVFRLPNPTLGTTFRYVIDQLQLTPIYDTGRLAPGSIRTNGNSGSSFSNPMTEESEASVTSAAHYYYRSAAYGPTMRTFYDSEEPKLPRVQPYTFGPAQRSATRQSKRSLTRQKSDIFENFDTRNYQIYRPRSVSRRSRRDLNNEYSNFESRMSIHRKLSRGPDNYASRARSSTRQKRPIYLEDEFGEYALPQYEYEPPPRLRSSTGITSRSGSLSRRGYRYY